MLQKGLVSGLKELYGPSLAIYVLGFNVVYVVMFTPCGFDYFKGHSFQVFDIFKSLSVSLAQMADMIYLRVSANLCTCDTIMC